MLGPSVDDPPTALPEGWVIAKDGTFELPSQITVNDNKAIENGPLNLYCSGFIRYKDILGNERETGYCWEYILIAYATLTSARQVT